MMNVPFEAKEPRLGIIGVGGRGTSLLEDLLAANGQVRAICDVVPDKAKHAQQLIEKAGQPSPALYTAKRSCIRATGRQRRSGPGHHCDAMAVARSHGGRRNAKWQARRC